MARDWRLAGYGLVLAPPALLAWSVPAGHPWTAFVAFVLASPVTRALLGVHPPGERVVGERLAAALQWLPAAYAVALLASLSLVAQGMADGPHLGGLDLLGLGLSLWTVLVFGLFPSHELLHRNGRAWIRLGSAVAGVCGYPAWGLEHATHHARPGACAQAEWARPDESVWRFTIRRLPVALRNAIDKDRSLRQTGHWPRGTTPLAVGTLALTAAAGGFWLLAGWTGAVVYLASALTVAVSAQIMTFVQHWGLGEDSIPDARRQELAWEDDCLMQACLTLNNSFHLAHHRAPQAPFFYLTPSPDSPRQPGCYVAMLVICVFPRLWRRLMLPVLDSYKREEKFVCAPGRRAMCMTPSRLLHAALDAEGRPGLPKDPRS